MPTGLQINGLLLTRPAIRKSSRGRVEDLSLAPEDKRPITPPTFPLGVWTPILVAHGLLPGDEPVFRSIVTSFATVGSLLTSSGVEELGGVRNAVVGISLWRIGS